MARNKSVDFLPEIFKTDANREFLGATLDQIVQEPKLKQIQGYIGNQFKSKISTSEKFLREPTVERANYQLEPGVVFKDEAGNVDQVITYTEILDTLKTNGAYTNRHDRLFSSEVYSWSPLIDLDKFTNHSQYYWLPSGPDSVTVASSDVPLTNNWDVTRGEDAYEFSSISGENPTLTLARGGEYTFTLDQAGESFYIQTERGADGLLNATPNISSRDVLGVTNNGNSTGTITFAVPRADQQKFYHELPEVENVDLATMKRFDEINGQVVSQLKNIDGVTDLEGKTIVFLNSTAGDSADLGWQYLDLWEENDGFDSDAIDQVEYIDSQADRYSVYRISYVGSGTSKVIKLSKVRAVSVHTKFMIEYGNVYSSHNFYKNSSGYFEEIPLLTAALDKLYYQDGTDEGRWGIINLVTSTNTSILNIDEDIVGNANYTSPNGITFTNGLKVIFRGEVFPSSYQDKEYYVEGVGTSIVLIPVTDLITPETYLTSETQPYDSVGYDSTAYDTSLNAPTGLDYITINKSTNDSNPWSRSNRWTHKDVIIATAEYNNTTPVFDNDNRAVRPIIEFKSNLKLFNYGTNFLKIVNIIDFEETDALSNVNGSTSYTTDGYTLVEGSVIIFANDTDSDVRNKIYTVSFVDVEGDNVQELRLVEEDISVLTNDLVLTTNGDTQQGKNYHYNGTTWIQSQVKSGVNQAPLFDVFDINGNSYSDTVYYPRTTFVGTKLFSYATGTGSDDATLGFPLKFLSIDNIGDIVFDNNLYKDSFEYGLPTTEKNINEGFIRKYSDRTTYTNEIGWTTYIDEFIPDQIFNFTFDGVSLVLDVLPKKNLNGEVINVFVENEFINKSKYTVTENTDNTVITFNYTVETGANVDVSIISDQQSSVAYYSVPNNLENNPFNENVTEFTLGTIRNHYVNLARNIKKLTGEVNGANNTRDLPNIEKYSRTIIQNSSPLIPAAEFLHSEEFDFYEALEFNANRYEKLKLKIIDYVNKNDTYDLTAHEILNKALSEINIGKNSTNAFYKSDMLPCADKPTITTYNVTVTSTDTFNTVNIYDFTKANNTGLLVYLNDVILTKDEDYTVSTDSPNVTILSTLTNGDVLKIYEYETTIGSYIPNTPTKLGLHPSYVPKKYADNSYITTTNVIQGHDGSITVAYDDVRDDVLLEFENRIYNNLKVNSSIPILEQDIVPGRFRTTDYSDEEVTNILSNSFLKWVGSNRLDYKTQDYSTTNEFTWNYSSASNKFDNIPLKGNWRGIYRNFYDTDTPHTTPWEMLGLYKKPTWWEDEYGPAPYTSGNLVLWEDLEAGIIKDPDNTRTDTRFARTGLTKIIPVDSQGNLLSPFKLLVTNYNKADLQKSWVIGDQSPTETAWRRSSTYRFALQRLFSLTKPAQYFALNIDRDLYKLDSTLNQYLLNGRQRIDVRDITTQTTTQPKHSYINWIADYHNNNGCECIEISQELSRTDIRLCYRMGSYSDKKFLKIFTDKSSPDSSNEGFQIPDENYSILLHTNQPITEIQYSSVIVQKTSDGWSVYGHSRLEPYFKIYNSINNGKYISLGEYSVPTEFGKTITTVPYGYVFRSKGGVVDFLASYGAFLEDNGLIFSSTENGKLINWATMAEEFLMFAGQEWGEGAMINLNPSAMTLEFSKELLVVKDIRDKKIDALDQNGIPLTEDDYSITRLENSFNIKTINNKSINLLNIKTVSNEHLIVFDNTSIFNDLIYQPKTGLRQYSLRVVGFTTFDWNGQLDAQGFILNQDNVNVWKENTYYTMGSIVKYKNSYWSAVTKLEPKTTFDFTDWQQINYKDIKKGLLPNIANKAGQIREYYNKHTSNLEEDVNLLAMGLIGYRPRNYFASLDDISRVNFYTGFIGNKGTTASSNIFDGIKFDKQETTYDLYENWQIKEATFGNSDNQVYIELELDKTKLESNPALVEVIENQSSVNIIPGVTADADDTADTTEITTDADRVVEIVRNPSTKKHQVVNVSDIYNQSTIHTSSNIYPIRSSKLTDTLLPTAGFVNTDDVDIALFEKTDLNDTAGVVFLNKISEGTTIWVAKDNAYDWNVYRVEQVGNIKSITENDTGVLTIVFYDAHELVTGETLVIQDISTEVNGAHKVKKVDSTTQLQITGTIETAYVQLTADADVVTTDTNLYRADHTTGNSYRLVSVRTESHTDLSSGYFSSLVDDSLAWVDNNADSKSSVYKKINGVWTEYRVQQDVVDTTLINKALIYNTDTKITDINIDYIDPLNGKILGEVQQNIDYITTEDPAVYNYDDSLTGTLWREDRVNQVWWDVSDARFLDCNGSDLTYNKNNWGKLFPNSTANIRQWVSSSKPPSQYNGEGTVVDATKYTVISSVDSQNTIIQTYYFWVTGITSLKGDKTLSISNIKNYIENPKSSGISYIAFYDRSTVGLHNTNDYVTDGILHISYNKTHNQNNVFNEFSLIKENNKYDFLSDSNFLKLQDSLIGGNKIGLAVPDTKLTPVQQVGLGFRPRQSMFSDRFEALKTYFTYVNSILSKHIISTSKKFTQLNKAESLPSESSGKYDLKVDDLDELNYQDLSVVATGYKYLVEVDTDNNGGWSIYEVQSNDKLLLTKVQSYDTTNIWNYIDWYFDDDARNAIHVDEVNDSSKLTSLNVNDQEYVKVISNANGKFEIYQYTTTGWKLVGLEDGTIEFSSDIWSGFSSQDNITVDTDLFTADITYNTADTGTLGNELRNVIKAINEDLFIDDLLIERNKSLIVLFDYILTEQNNIDWLTKTSLVDVEQNVRALDQFETYKRDDQTFLSNYIEESKPYHVKIKEFLLKYNGTDQYNTDVADFDCPVYYDTTFEKYISPILDYDGISIKSDQSNFDEDGKGLKETDYNIWELTPWNYWFDNRGLSVKSVTIVNGGTGFESAPKLTFSGGGATKQATAVTRIDTTGKIVEVTITDGGEGYITTPTLSLDNGGTNVSLVPILENKLVRNVITEIKYDRVEYDYTVVDWVSNTDPSLTTDSSEVKVDSDLYTVDSLDTVVSAGGYVRYNNKVYSQNVTRAFKDKFLLEDYTIVDSSTLKAANRTMGYYTPTKVQPGLNYALLVKGIDYPGVVLNDPDFSSTDSIDSTIESRFTNTYIGTKPEDINVEGGQFIDTYSSHAPEELVPGSIFDTLDITVNTRPGFDYLGDGHGFDTQNISYEYTTLNNTFSFKNVTEHPVTVTVINSTTQRTLYETDDYTIDWVNKEITLIDNVFDGNTITFVVHEMGGGNQLLRTEANGADFGLELTYPVPAQEVYEVVIFKNGIQMKSGFTSTSEGKLTIDNTLTTADSTVITADKTSTSESSQTKITFTESYDASDHFNITIFGFESTQYDWSTPISTKFEKRGADTTLITADDTDITADYVSTDYNLGETVYINGKNRLNAIVEVEGERLRPPEGARYVQTSGDTDFRLPTEGGVDHTLVSNSEIVVYVDNDLQTLTTDYTVITVVVGSDTYKDVRFTTAPAEDSVIEVYTITPAEYTIDTTGILRIKPSVTVSGTDYINVVTWNDTRQQDVFTKSFEGPTVTTLAIVDLFDSGSFDSVGFDFVGSSSTDVNLFDLGREVDNSNRLWVTLNGNVLTSDVDYSVSGQNLLLAGELIGPTDIVSVTSFTSNVVPDKLSFKIFKDMTGNTAMYRIKNYNFNEVKLVKELGITDDVIYVNDVSLLSTPNLELGNFGIVFIDGERITFREVDTITNTISGLRRGTAGTGLTTHSVGTRVNDMTDTNLVSGSMIESDTLDSQTKDVEFTYDKIWYANGTTTASNGIPLQNQNTKQALFVKDR